MLHTQQNGAEFRKVHQYNVFCTFHPAQHAFAAMIDADTSMVIAIDVSGNDPDSGWVDISVR